MRRHLKRRGACAPAVGAAALLVALPGRAAAHEKKSIGPLVLTIGWGDEPAFSGSKNAVEVGVSDAAGAPALDADGSLSVEVSFGDERVALPMRPAFGRPGKYRAWLVPTRAGTYSFHITGTIKGQPIDTTSTCSNRTFACVGDISDIQFPAKDPSAGQLAERVSRALPRAERAIDSAATARNVALAAIGVAVLALAATIAAGGRKGKGL